ncbi:uncharacterized protein si:dkey-13m1.5 [Danio aesculapii]|uniref:uncharacterized protein si:dkey-13m1.5 n=1 Tax=Danio aesculapii TaxID=1142201 RepID=UPI0024C0D49D|nr:uncharacterized protein si:dkey-13m1.5 [Danio aesculapii]
MYATVNKGHFKLIDTAKVNRVGVSRPASPHFQYGEQGNLSKFQTETALSFPSHPPVPPIEPKLTHLTMQSSNFKMPYGDVCGNFETSHADFKPMPMSAAQLLRPTTAVWTNVLEIKCPETMYSSYYTKHDVSPILKAKETTKTGVSLNLRQDKKDKICSSSYQEQFQYRQCPSNPPLQSIEKQRVQYSSVAMGDRDKILNNQTTYSTYFRPSVDNSSPKFRNNTKSLHINLRELPDDKWTTTSSDQFCAHTFGPIHLEHRSPTLSSVFKGELLNANQERLSTTNQQFFPKMKSAKFPVHVDGSSIRTLSNVEFGKPNMAGCFYITTTQEQFPHKEVVHPKTPVYPPSHVLFEQEPDQLLTTMQNDFIPLNSRRQELSPGQLQQVKETHIRPRNSDHDFRTTHNETFVPKPYCKEFLENPPLQHISHMPF